MSNKTVRKNISHLLLFSVVMAALGALFQWITNYYALRIASPAIPFIVIFFFIITLFTLFIVLKTAENKKFIFNYMLSRIIKLSCILLFLILYIVFNTEDRWNFAIAFLIIYFAYSIFEIVVLKNNNEKSVQ